MSYIECTGGSMSYTGLCAAVWTCQSAQKAVSVTKCVARQEYSENSKPKLSIRATGSRSLYWESSISAQINWRVWSFNYSASYDNSFRPVCRLLCRGYPESHHRGSGEVLCVRPSTIQKFSKRSYQNYFRISQPCARLEYIMIFSKLSKYRKYLKYHDIFDIFDIFQKMKISNKLYNSGCT